MLDTSRPLKLQKAELDHHVEAILAEAKGRKLTEEEQKQLDEYAKKYAAIETHEKAAARQADFRSALEEAIGGSATGNGKSDGNRIVLARGHEIKSLGRQYVESEAFKWFATTKATRSGMWESPAAEIDRRATLTSDPASGGALVVPDYQADIISGPVLRVVVGDLFAPGTTDSNSVPSQVETEFTNAAAPVLEGAAKPESTLVFESQPEPVRKLAHWIPITEEMLEDVPGIASYIDTRLRYGILRKEDQQLLSGTGVAPELLGVLNRTGLAAAVVRTDPQTNADAILKQIVAIESATGYMVSGIVLNPLAWGAIVGSKDSQGNYLSAGAPFVSPAGTPMLWGRTVALTDQITSTVALVGAFKTAGQVFRRGGIRVNASNSHQDYFVRNLVAIRAEERLALAVYRPAAFGRVTTLTV